MDKTGYCAECGDEVTGADHGICAYCGARMDTSLAVPPVTPAILAAHIRAAMAAVRRAATDEKEAES